jgi:hypothetical protein
MPPLNDKDAFGLETGRRMKKRLENLREREKQKGRVCFFH